jgi:hypothetical protein
LERQLASLEWQLDMLTAQATTITQGKKSRVSAKTNPNIQISRLDEKLAKRSLEVKCSFVLSSKSEATLLYSTVLGCIFMR